MALSDEEPVYIHLPPGSAPPEIDAFPSKMIVLAEVEVSPNWRKSICDWIVESGCRSMMAWGISCEAWHDGVDVSSWVNFPDRDIPDEQLVMTTWHDNETLEQSLWFCRYTAFHPIFELSKTYIIHVSNAPSEEEIVDAYWTESPDE